MCRHCVSAVSPDGSTLPTDSQIPHVAGGDDDDDDGGLPAGERCYLCDVGDAGIPLERPLTDRRRRRYRRHANYTPPHLPVFGPIISHTEVPSSVLTSGGSIQLKIHQIHSLEDLLGGRTAPSSAGPGGTKCMEFNNMCKILGTIGHQKSKTDFFLWPCPV